MAQDAGVNAYDVPGQYSDSYKQRVGRDLQRPTEELTADIDGPGITHHVLRTIAARAEWDATSVSATPKPHPQYMLDAKAIEKDTPAAMGPPPAFTPTRAEDLGFPDEGYPRPRASSSYWLDTWREALYHKAPTDAHKALRFKALQRLYTTFCEHAVEIVVYLVHTKTEAGGMLTGGGVGGASQSARGGGSGMRGRVARAGRASMAAAVLADLSPNHPNASGNASAPQRSCAPSCSYQVRDLEVTFAGTQEAVKLFASHEAAMKATANKRKGLDAVNSTGEYGIAPYPYVQVTYLGHRALVRPVLPVKGAYHVDWANTPARVGRALNLKPHHVGLGTEVDQAGVGAQRTVRSMSVSASFAKSKHGQGVDMQAGTADEGGEDDPRRPVFPVNCDAVFLKSAVDNRVYPVSGLERLLPPTATVRTDKVNSVRPWLTQQFRACIVPHAVRDPKAPAKSRLPLSSDACSPFGSVKRVVNDAEVSVVTDLVKTGQTHHVVNDLLRYSFAFAAGDSAAVWAALPHPAPKRFSRGVLALMPTSVGQQPSTAQLLEHGCLVGRAMHLRGVNMRYLGVVYGLVMQRVLLVRSAGRSPFQLDSPAVTKFPPGPQCISHLHGIARALQTEMIARVLRDIVNRHLRDGEGAEVDPSHKAAGKGQCIVQLFRLVFDPSLVNGGADGGGAVGRAADGSDADDSDDGEETLEALMAARDDLFFDIIVPKLEAKFGPAMGADLSANPFSLDDIDLPVLFHRVLQLTGLVLKRDRATVLNYKEMNKRFCENLVVGGAVPVVHVMAVPRGVPVYDAEGEDGYFQRVAFGLLRAVVSAPQLCRSANLSRMVDRSVEYLDGVFYQTQPSSGVTPNRRRRVSRAACVETRVHASAPAHGGVCSVAASLLNLGCPAAERVGAAAAPPESTVLQALAQSRSRWRPDDGTSSPQQPALLESDTEEATAGARTADASHRAYEAVEYDWLRAKTPSSTAHIDEDFLAWLRQRVLDLHDLECGLPLPSQQLLQIIVKHVGSSVPGGGLNESTGSTTSETTSLSELLSMRVRVLENRPAARARAATVLSTRKPYVKLITGVPAMFETCPQYIEKTWGVIPGATYVASGGPKPDVPLVIVGESVGWLYRRYADEDAVTAFSSANRSELQAKYGLSRIEDDDRKVELMPYTGHWYVNGEIRPPNSTRLAAAMKKVRRGLRQVRTVAAATARRNAEMQDANACVTYRLTAFAITDEAMAAFQPLEHGHLMWHLVQGEPEYGRTSIVLGVKDERLWTADIHTGERHELKKDVYESGQWQILSRRKLDPRHCMTGMDRGAESPRLKIGMETPVMAMMRYNITLGQVVLLADGTCPGCFALVHEVESQKVVFRVIPTDREVAVEMEATDELRDHLETFPVRIANVVMGLTRSAVRDEQRSRRAVDTASDNSLQASPLPVILAGAGQAVRRRGGDEPVDEKVATRIAYHKTKAALARMRWEHSSLPVAGGGGEVHRSAVDLRLALRSALTLSKLGGGTLSAHAFSLESLPVRSFSGTELRVNALSSCVRAAGGVAMGHVLKITSGRWLHRLVVAVGVRAPHPPAVGLDCLWGIIQGGPYKGMVPLTGCTYIATARRMRTMSLANGTEWSDPPASDPFPYLTYFRAVVHFDRATDSTLRFGLVHTQRVLVSDLYRPGTVCVVVGVYREEIWVRPEGWHYAVPLKGHDQAELFLSTHIRVLGVSVVRPFTDGLLSATMLPVGVRAGTETVEAGAFAAFGVDDEVPEGEDLADDARWKLFLTGLVRGRHVDPRSTQLAPHTVSHMTAECEWIGVSAAAAALRDVMGPDHFILGEPIEHQDLTEVWTHTATRAHASSELGGMVTLYEWSMRRSTGIVVGAMDDAVWVRFAGEEHITPVDVVRIRTYTRRGRAGGGVQSVPTVSEVQRQVAHAHLVRRAEALAQAREQLAVAPAGEQLLPPLPGSPPPPPHVPGDGRDGGLLSDSAVAPHLQHVTDRDLRSISLRFEHLPPRLLRVALEYALRANNLPLAFREGEMAALAKLAVACKVFGRPLHVLDEADAARYLRRGLPSDAPVSQTNDGAEQQQLQLMTAHFNRQVERKLEELNSNRRRKMEQILRVRAREEAEKMEAERLAREEKERPLMLQRRRRTNDGSAELRAARAKERIMSYITEDVSPRVGLDEVAQRLDWIIDRVKEQEDAREEPVPGSPMASPRGRGRRDLSPHGGIRSVEDALREAAEANPTSAAPVPPPLTEPHPYIATERFAYVLRTSEVILFDTSPAAFAHFGEGLHCGCEIAYSAWDAAGTGAIILGVHNGTLWRIDTKPRLAPAQPFAQVATANDLRMRYPMTIVHRRDRTRPSRTADPFVYPLWNCLEVQFDISVEACSRFGVRHGERYVCGIAPPHAAVAIEQLPDVDGIVIAIIGVYEHKLHYSYLDNAGALAYEAQGDILTQYEMTYLYTAPIAELSLDDLPEGVVSYLGGVTNDLQLPLRRLFNCAWAQLLFDTTLAAMKHLGFDTLRHRSRIVTPGGRGGVVIGVARCCVWVHWDGDRGASLCERWSELRAATLSVASPANRRVLGALRQSSLA